jgi:signal peptidase II
MRMTLSRKLRLACVMLLLACTVGCDQTSKHIARVGLSQAGSITLPRGLGELRLAENPGSFMSLRALLPEPARLTVFTLSVGVGLLVLFVYLTSRTQICVVRFVGLSLVMAGGLSNLLDRILRHGLVTDFATIRIGPFQTGIFNAADVLIMIGVSLIICTVQMKTLPTGRMQ